MLEPSEKYAVVFAVCRLEVAGVKARGGSLRQRDFAVVKVVRTEAEAQDEVERLQMPRRGEAVYFYQATRMPRDEPRDAIDFPEEPGKKKEGPH